MHRPRALEPTDQMRAALKAHTCCDCNHEEALADLLAIVEQEVRTAVAADIEAALAADMADSDVPAGRRLADLEASPDGGQKKPAQLDNLTLESGRVISCPP